MSLVCFDLGSGAFSVGSPCLRFLADRFLLLVIIYAAAHTNRIKLSSFAFFAVVILTTMSIGSLCVWVTIYGFCRKKKLCAQMQK